jgi:phosphoribosylformylglycinamidine synthase
MAFAGGLGVRLDLTAVPHALDGSAPAERLANLLFSESNSRFLCEVPRDRQREFEQVLTGLPWGLLGEVTADATLELHAESGTDQAAAVIRADINALRKAWLQPLRW